MTIRANNVRKMKDVAQRNMASFNKERANVRIMADNSTRALAEKYPVLDGKAKEKINKLLVNNINYAEDIGRNIPYFYDLLSKYGLSTQEITSYLTKNNYLLVLNNSVVKKCLTVYHDMGLDEDVLFNEPQRLTATTAPEDLYALGQTLLIFGDKVSLNFLSMLDREYDNGEKKILRSVFPLTDKKYFAMSFAFDKDMRIGTLIRQK